MAELTRPAEGALPGVRNAYLDYMMLLVAVAGSLLIVYLIGLEATQGIHDAFHDVRHAFGFPCH